MLISDNQNSSQITTCLKAAPHFLLQEAEAARIIEGQIRCIEENWSMVCDEADLSEIDRNLMWRNQILNPFVFEGLEGGALKELARYS